MGLFDDYNVSLSRFMYGDNSQNADNKNTSFSFFNFPNIFNSNYFAYNPFMYTFPMQTNFMLNLQQIPSVFFNPIPSYNMQTIHLSNPLSESPKLTNISSSSNDTFVKSSGTKTSTLLRPSLSNITNNPKIDLSWWKAQGYNEKKGKELAANTKKHSDDLYRRGIKAQCGRGVRLGINDTYYNGSEHYTKFGQARLTGDNTLSSDSNFKKIDVTGLKLSKKDIPAGAIVIYDAGYSNSKYSYCGHIEVADGNGHGYSDFTSTLLQNHGIRREPKEIWIPV